MDRRLSVGFARFPRSSRWAVFGVALATLLSVASAAGVAASAQNGPGYGVRPALVDGATASGASFDHSLGAGDSVEDAIEIFNLTDTRAAFDVYATDLVELDEGKTVAASPAAKVSGSGAWITPVSGEVEVDGRTSAIVEFAVNVPPDTPPGVYGAAVVVEPKDSAAAGAIESRTRIGIRVNIDVLADGVQADDAGQAAPIPSNNPTSSPPWLLIVTILGALVTLALIVMATRDRRSAWLARRRDEREMLKEYRRTRDGGGS